MCIYQSLSTRPRPSPQTRAPAPTQTPAPPQTPVTPNLPAFIIADNPDAHRLQFAPCANGTVFPDSAVIWQQMDYTVKALSVGGGNRAFAHIVSLDHEIATSIPCSLLHLKVGIIHDRNFQTQTNSIYRSKLLYVFICI